MKLRIMDGGSGWKRRDVDIVGGELGDVVEGLAGEREGEEGTRSQRACVGCVFRG